MTKITIAVIAALLILLGLNSVFVVREGQNALLLQFGRIVRTDFQPGLHLKIPLIQQVMPFDNRILSLDAAPERYFTSEKKSVNVDFYVKWRIADNALYYRATGGDQLQAAQRLTPIIKDALRFEFNARTLQELISGGRKDITERVRVQTDAAARKNLGIAVVDVRIKRIDLPDEVSESVYKRMRAERLQLANELRYTGQESAEIARARYCVPMPTATLPPSVAMATRRQRRSTRNPTVRIRNSSRSIAAWPPIKSRSRTARVCWC